MTRRCQGCSELFEHARKGPAPSYCATCRNAHRRANYAANPAPRLAVNRRWSDANPEQMRAYRHATRARKFDPNAEHITDREIWDANPAGPGRCSYCPATFKFDERRTWNVDHAIPLARGGRHTLSNLVLACPSCNCTKRNLTPEEYIAS